jgi:hypothetical protein
LSGRFISDLCFTGPGAGPDVTAATILDDVVEAMETNRRVVPERAAPLRAATLAAPAITPWFVRARFPGLVPSPSAISQIFASHNLATTRVADARGATRWVCIAPATSDRVDHALAEIEATHRVCCFAMRSL